MSEGEKPEFLDLKDLVNYLEYERQRMMDETQGLLEEGGFVIKEGQESKYHLLMGRYEGYGEILDFANNLCTRVEPPQEEPISDSYRSD